MEKPEVLKRTAEGSSSPKVLGLDEAGRGPVIGPLVLGAVLVEADRLRALEALGVADSKRLSRARREALYPRIEALALAVETVVWDPDELEGSLTEVELRGMASVIRRLRPGFTFLDAPVPPAAVPRFLSRLRSLAQSSEVIGANRAESLYPVVAAASIVAKVGRDREIRELHRRYGDFGWGYPGEPKTRAFLLACRRKGRWPPIVRRRWKTVQRMEQEH